MSGLDLPGHLVTARRTPRFDHASLPAPLARAHRTTVWATLHVEAGTVRYVDLVPGRDGDERRDERLETGDHVVIPPEVDHEIDPSTDARFFVQFYREPDAPVVLGRPAGTAQRPVSRRPLGAPRP